MSEAILKVENLSKSFIISHEEKERYTSLRDVLSNTVKQLIRGNEREKLFTNEEFWALDDLNFEIKRGDRIGIIGRNGAGKSTLLKILSRITEPTKGRVTIEGRVASLLEVGTGFHPELTGRENIFLNGAILGMSRHEIRTKFDEIVAFAEVEKFLDTPVKRYSSGMYVRLAFAVAAHLEPEILIIDEVLAVGDAQFQKKCLGKMEDVSKDDGRTVLFVSHNMSAVQSLCNRGLVLERGCLSYQGGISEATVSYLKQFRSGARKVSWAFEIAPGNSLAKLLYAEAKGTEATSINDDFIEIGNEIQLEFVFFNSKVGTTSLDVTFHLIDALGNLVFVGSSGMHDTDLKLLNYGEVQFICRIPGHFLHEGNYNIGRLLLVQDRGIVNYEIKNVLQFEVVGKHDETFGWVGTKEGVVKPKLEWTYRNAS